MMSLQFATSRRCAVLNDAVQGLDLLAPELHTDDITARLSVLSPSLCSLFYLVTGAAILPVQCMQS